MTLKKSIAGIRGTIGGLPGENLTPVDVIQFVSAFGSMLLDKYDAVEVVIGRDGRITGPHISALTINTLLLMGIDVLDLGIATTPTVEIAVEHRKAQAGIIITASHNPKEWNALKFLNEKGEFISAHAGETILNKIKDQQFEYADVNHLGTLNHSDDYARIHIAKILSSKFIDVEKIRSKKFTAVVDCINSAGVKIIPELLRQLNVNTIVVNGEITGDFAHIPEPLPENLKELPDIIKKHKADVAFVVDPDADRLALFAEDGSYFGEEYTIVACADSILKKEKGNLVSNLSSSRALSDIASKYGVDYQASKVGEVNVVQKMKDTNAVFGGEGNGGVILPEQHYGRDAMVGIALILQLMSEENRPLSEIRSDYPDYEMSKNKIDLPSREIVPSVIEGVAKAYSQEKLNRADGIKIDFEKGWVHLRESNTEAILRVYSEAQTREKADALAQSVIQEVQKLLN